MPQGDKSKYTARQKRKAAHIADTYQARGVPEPEAEARAWATVNKQSGGGERPGGSGEAKSDAAKRADREDSARRAAQSRTSSTEQAHDEASLDRLSVRQLLAKARERGIAGRSRMRKDQLIQALRQA